MALITQAIPTSNLELVRDRIADILRVEFPNQAVLDPSFVAPTIYICKVDDVDKEQMPAINVWVLSGEYDRNNQRSQHGSYTYVIDVYANSKATAKTPADELSAKALDRLIAMTRYILMSPVYRTLGFTPSINNGIELTEVKGFQVSPKSKTADALSSLMGQLMFNVKVPEGAELQTGQEFELAMSTHEIENTGDGYQIQANA